MRTITLSGVFLVTLFGLLLEVAPQIPLQAESEPAISVLAPTTHVVSRGVQPIWKIQTDSPNELYLLNIEWYPVNVAEHTGAEYKPIPAPEIRIRKADATGNPGQEIYFDLSAVVSSVDRSRVIVPLKSSSQAYFLTMISKDADFSLSMRLSSPYLSLLPVGSESALATDKSSISVHVESAVPDERYCLVVSVCEGRLKAGSVGADGGNIVGFRGKEGVHYVPFIAKANIQNKIVLVNNGPGLVVSSAKIIRLVAGAKIEEIARRQSLLEAEIAATPNLPSTSVKQTGTL